MKNMADDTTAACALMELGNELEFSLTCKRRVVFILLPSYQYYQAMDTLFWKAVNKKRNTAGISG